MGEKYFKGLNYTLGNEDTSVEYHLVKSLLPKNVFSICGSGGRALPLGVSNCELLTLADLSIEQIYLAKLRSVTYKELNYDDFLKFWGYFPYRDNDNIEFRKKTFYSLKLDKEVKDFFDKVFFEINFESVLYIGKWEKTFQLMAKINKFMLGKDYDKLLCFDSLSDQISYYHSSFPLLKWKAVIALIGNKSFFNALLYKGDFIEKNSSESHFQYYYNAFDRLFTHDLAQKSFFLHLCFYGKIQSFLGLPIEASSVVFEDIKKSRANYQFAQEDFVSHLSKSEVKYDFLSLSDVPSYFKGDLERDFLQMIRPGLNKDAVIVIRSYLRKPYADQLGFIDISDQYKKLIDDEKVQMYDISILKYIGE